ncbi:DUF5348 domain-containing protein [Pseudogracilibacillus sp. SO30301A]|uniref:DUF5348 domain-containing protein n=1 Tax=Pseudogracilibacillus sp. SO30301A TaxID=3098291 RepID=UPI00300E03C2
MIFDVGEQEWRMWIGLEEYEAFIGMNFEIRIQKRYYKTIFEKDYNDWFVTIEDEVDFSLRLVETYKVRISEKELLPIKDLPF